MEVMDKPIVGSILGLISLLFYIVTLLPTILRVVFPESKETGIPKLLLKHRRGVGILAFLFAVGHAYIYFNKRNLDFFDPKTFWVYVHGGGTFIIFTLLAITSNDWSIKKLKKNWKQLHQLTYPAMFLVAWHIWGKMLGHWSFLTPIGVLCSTAIIVLYCFRLWTEHQAKQAKQDKQQNTKKKASKV
ncbi:ferric reductase-like transmembrane domain-containing protein [Aetokthonos hydrillicola Thurmond2011]|jgi:sulfoxide reductase heme-binding subunit YedZ|uniref:Ferric reductase-like transmembrane domain-containing protein n=2 Tax=Aetokthonos TaxID=1550243 RepID=A0AAP5I6P8_9CYAN|nr:ferric reductase-like transmembrane domain-containing protein [Aetokthonos hydrillicola]MBO3457659.1 iron reductase [Aetokthonos hydrillicola CCALA 1050]MBW4587938.1 ferric reductase-like transmembrane domain-containing protein [Aetokthonos hydrillicola CCALA 1050]MDR9894657.1 ferric reductase-like transmembrane domain-containing protein [Aetokthonos hydrillicola Thurmond2011]